MIANRWAIFALRKGFQLIGGIGVLLVLTFAITQLIPGDPARIVAGENASVAQVSSIRSQLGLDQPIAVQFLQFLGGIIHGDLGESFTSGQPVIAIIGNRFPFTAGLAIIGIVVAITIAVVVGVGTAALTRNGRNSWLNAFFSWSTAIIMSLPVYVVGVIAVVLFAVTLHWFPAGGADSIRSYVLPCLVLVLSPICAIARLVRREADTILDEGFVRSARGRRLTAFRLYSVHVMPNIVTSALTLSGLVLANMIGGAIIVENVFAWPGLGQAAVDAIVNRDFPLIQGIIFTIGCLAIVVNLSVDVVLALIDRRTISGGESLV